MRRGSTTRLFCAELKHHDGRWTLIELHARPGEDPGLDETIWDPPVLDVIEAAARHAPAHCAG